MCVYYLGLCGDGLGLLCGLCCMICRCGSGRGLSFAAAACKMLYFLDC